MKQKTHKIFLLLLFAVLLHSGNVQSQCSDLTQTTPPVGKFDYTYWSSPVTSINIFDVSPGTQWDKFYAWDPTIPNWVYQPPTTSMVPGVGYIIRAPNSHYPGTNIAPYTADFGAASSSGVPNNGNISVNILNSASNMNLIGNPYCDNLWADCFIRDGNADMDGTLYFWSHCVPIDFAANGTTNPQNPLVDGLYNYNTNSYATYNLMGGTAAGYIATNSSDVALLRPNGYIPRAQGFFITATNSGTITFTNDMRSSNPGIFFKTDEPSENPPPPPRSCDVSRHRLWLQITQGTLFRETLVGYANSADGATTGPGLDRGFDGPQAALSLSGAAYVNLYSLVAGNSTKLTIQGRALSTPFNLDDVIPLGYTCSAGGNFTITQAEDDNLFDSRNYWLREWRGGSIFNYYDIKNNPSHTFTSQTFNSNPIVDDETRFQIIFRLPNPPTLVPRENVCGGTLLGIGTVFQSNPITAAAYSYQVSDYTTGTVVGTYSGGYTFTLNQTGIQFGGHYLIRVATYQVDGNWVYGPPCEIYTPAAPPPMKLCSNTDPITVGAADAIWGNNHYTFFNLPVATTFMYRIINDSNPSQNTEVTKTGATSYKLYLNDANNSSISSTPFAIALNTTYSVEVNVFWNGVWTGYGPKCYYKTPLSKNNEPSSIGFSAIVHPNPFENNFRIDVVTSSSEMIEATVYDMLGRQIEIFRLHPNELHSQEIGVKYPTGVYNIIVKQGDDIQTLRAIKK